MWRLVFNSVVVRAVARSLGGAILAGFGWKLGSDAYDRLKRTIDPSYAPSSSQPQRGAPPATASFGDPVGSEGANEGAR